MEVNHVEPGDIGKDQFHQPDMLRQRLPAARIAPECAGTPGDEPRPRLRIAAGEQGHFVPQPHQLFGQVGDDALRPAVEFRRHAFKERERLVQCA